jgi:hypothetical protein
MQYIVIRYNWKLATREVDALNFLGSSRGSAKNINHRKARAQNAFTMKRPFLRSKNVGLQTRK